MKRIPKSCNYQSAISQSFSAKLCSLLRVNFLILFMIPKQFLKNRTRRCNFDNMTIINGFQFYLCDVTLLRNIIFSFQSSFAQSTVEKRPIKLTSNAAIGFEKLGKLIFIKVKTGFSVSIADLKVCKYNRGARERLLHFAYYFTSLTSLDLWINLRNRWKVNFSSCWGIAFKKMTEPLYFVISSVSVSNHNCLTCLPCVHACVDNFLLLQ